MTSNKNTSKPYPEILVHTDRLLSLVAVLCLILGGTLLIIQIWDENFQNWVWKLVGNLGAMIVACMALVGINQMFGRMRGLFTRAIHFVIAFGITACFIVSSLVIWGATETDAALKTIGTIVVLLLVACIGIPISKMASGNNASSGN